MPDEKQPETADEHDAARSPEQRPTSAHSTAEAADVVMDTYAKLARPGR